MKHRRADTDFNLPAYHTEHVARGTHIVAAKNRPNGRDNYYPRDKERTHRCQNPVAIDTDPAILHAHARARPCTRTRLWTTCTSNERGWTSLMLHAAMRGCWQTHFLKPVLGCPRTVGRITYFPFTNRLAFSPCLVASLDVRTFGYFITTKNDCRPGDQAGGSGAGV